MVFGNCWVGFKESDDQVPDFRKGNQHDLIRNLLLLLLPANNPQITANTAHPLAESARYTQWRP